VPHSDEKVWMDSPRFHAMCEALLASGHQVRFHARGLSMQPNLRDGDAVIVAAAQESDLRRGDIILSHDRHSLRVHRLISAKARGELITRGDAGLENDDAAQSLIGRVTAIERNGQRIAASGWRAQMLSGFRALARRIQRAAGVRLRKLASSFAFLACLSLLGMFWSVAPAAAQADLAVTADTAAPNPVASGGTITYTVTVVNNGPNTATTPSVRMVIPANTTYVSFTRTGGTGTWNCTGVVPGGTGTLTCTRTANMGTGSTATFTIVVAVNTSTPGNTVITNTVSISSTTADPTPLNNSASTNVTVNAADLALTQAANPTVAQPGGNITYTLTLTNNGANTAANAVVYQQTPPNTTFQSVTVSPAGAWTCNTPFVGSTGQILCTDGANLANGAVVTFTIVVNINAGTTLGTVILNSADTTSTTADPAPNNNASTSSVLVESGTQADLAVTMTAAPTPVFISSNLTYTLTVQNLGLVNTADGKLVDTLPAGTTAAGFSTTQGSCAGTTTVTCTFGAVTTGSTITVAISLTTPASPGALNNSATVSSTTADPVASNNTATTITVVQPLVCASPGKDGAGGTLNGIVNAYYPPAGAGTLAAASNSVALGAAAAGGAQTSIAAGDLLLVIQMQDAAINPTNTSAYGHGTPGEPSSGWTNLNNSGNFEFVTATNAVPNTGGTLNFLGTGPTGGLLNTYTSAAYNAGVQGQRTYQVIRVPQYTSATLSSGLTAMIWNGTTGGVLAIDVASQLTLSGTVAVDGLGFRGGGGRILTGGTGVATDYVTLSTNAANGSKGEGIAGTPEFVVNGAIASPAQTPTDTGVEGYPNGSYSRGAPGNAGGGATDADPPVNDQNSGGGGGGNGGAGGQGGFGWNSAGIVGGFGGAAFPGTSSAMIMGGGGGAGTTNNGSFWSDATQTGNHDCGGNCTGIYSSGAPGGAIVIMHAGSVTGTGTVTSNGLTALDEENDGAGGGGAGGSIRVLASSGGLGGLTVVAVGGNGGDTWPEQVPGTPFPGNRHGAGGGGSGGAVFLSGSPAASNVSGGSPGASTTALDPYGATVGAPGATITTYSIPETPGTQPGSECASADLAVTNSGSPNPVFPGPGPGNIITYTQSVTNNGPLDALNATFSEAIPANTTFQSLNNPAGSGWTCITPAVGGTGTISCSNPDVAKAASTTFTVAVAVNTGVAAGTVITDVIDATSGTNDPILPNNSATVQTTVGLSTTADLSITNSGTPNPVLAGSNITYTVVVKNNGAATASSVVFSEPIPASTTFISVVPSPAAGWTCSVVAGTLSCSNPSVASGASTTFTVVLNVTAGTAAGTQIVDTASVASSTTDPNPNNNSATSTIVVATAGQADLSITSSATPNPVTSSNNISYTQVVTNNGPAVSGLATFTDTIPTGTTFVSFTPPVGWNCGATIPPVGGTGTISCSIATLALNATASFPLVVKVNSGTAPGTSILNTANINIPCAAASDPNCSNNSASTSVTVASPTQADVAILKTASPEPVNQNTNITYALQITNNGPALAQGVTVNDPLPAQVSFSSVSTTQGTCTYTAATTTVSCNLGSLSVGGLALVTINASATTFSSATLSTNTATVSATTGDPNLTNNTSSSISTIAAPTAVQLVSFRAAPLPEGGVLLEWKTREEVRNLGFNVYREDSTGRHRLNPSLIAGSALMLRGGLPQHAAKSYQWIDSVASSPASAYWLEDVDLSGAKISHGPAEITGPVSPQRAFAAARLLTNLNQSLAANSSAASAPFAQRPRISDPEIDAVLRAVPPGIERAVLDREPAVKISVRSEGWYHVTRAELVAAGLDPRANARTLQLFAEGVEQPLLILGNLSGPLGANDAIEFYGTGIDTPYSDARVYWLVEGREAGKRISQLATNSFSGPEPTSFPFTVVRQDRTTYFAALLNGEDQDNFFGAVVTSSPVDQELDVVHSAPSGLPVTLDITLQGATEGQDHSVSVLFNGSFLGNIVFVGQPLFKSTFPVDPGLLHDGANIVTLTALDGDNDVSVVQSIALHYAHTYDADANWLRLQAASGSHLHIAGFSNSQIRVFDITNPLAIEELAGHVQPITAGFAIDVVVSSSSFNGSPRRLLAFSSDQLSAPASFAFHHPSVLRERQEGADILIVTHPDFAASLAPLVRLREEQGHIVKLVTIDEIFDAFHFGERTPYALRDFLLFSQRNWRRHPQSILLVGDASLDPRNFLGFGDFDFVPTRLVDTAALKTASDDWFTDFTQTGYATVPIGRLPVRTAPEADLVVSKIVNYERGAFAGAWNAKALVVADQNIGDDFATTSTSIADSLKKSLTVTRIISGNVDPQTVKQQLLDSINQGQVLVNYVGHGSVEQWSFSDLFDNSDAAALQNGNRLPVFLLMDCLNGFFQDVYTQSLAETLLLAKDGGAVAVWASSGFTDAGPQASMNRALIQTLTSNPNVLLGHAILAAKKLTGDSDVRRTWILFGDPAMRIHFAPPAPSHPSHREGRSDRDDRPVSKRLQ